MSDGGTNIFCPLCQEFTECPAIPLSNFSGETSYFGDRKLDQQRSPRDFPDLSFFMRGRKCLVRGHEFITSEIHEDALFELIQLRKKLNELRQDFETFTMDYSLSSQLSSLQPFIEKLEKWYQEHRKADLPY